MAIGRGPLSLIVDITKNGVAHHVELGVRLINFDLRWLKCGHGLLLPFRHASKVQVVLSLEETAWRVAVLGILTLRIGVARLLEVDVGHLTFFELSN